MSLLSDIGTAIKNKLGGTSVDNTVPRYDGTTCKLKGSGVTISDTNAVTASGGFVGNLSGGFVSATTGTFSGYLKTESYISVVSPNIGTTGALVIRDASGNPNTAYIQATNNERNIQYGFIKFNSDGYLVPSGPIIGTTTTALGYNQSWQDVTASRAAGVTYTNSTGKPIIVYVSRNNTSNASWQFIINGVSIGHVNGYGTTNGGSIVVPHGYTYSVSASSHAIVLWSELR